MKMNPEEAFADLDKRYKRLLSMCFPAAFWIGMLLASFFLGRGNVSLAVISLLAVFPMLYVAFVYVLVWYDRITRFILRAKAYRKIQEQPGL